MSLPAVTLFAIALTVTAYALSLQVRKRYPSPWTTPVFFSTAIIITVLLACGINFKAYGPAKDVMTFLLGPATVALAIPLYKNRRVFIANLRPAVIGLLSGALGTMLAAIAIAEVFRLAPGVVASLGIKSITAAVGIELAGSVHGDATLVAVFVVTTGMIGSILGPWLLDRAGIWNPIARGVAMGTIAHGQGTAQAALEGEVQGAIAGVAMGVSAIVVSLAAPFIVPFFAF